MSAELACTYAALILNDDDVEITGDKITAILKVFKKKATVNLWISIFRPPTSTLNHSGHHSSLVPSRTSMSAAWSPTSVQVLVPGQLPEVPPPLVVMLPLLKHQRKKPRRPNPHPKKTTIWVSDFSTKSHASRLSGTSNKTIFQRSNSVFLFLAGV